MKKSKLTRSKKILFIGYLRNFPNRGLNLLLKFIKNKDYELGVIGDGPNLIHYKTNSLDCKESSFMVILMVQQIELMKKYSLLVLQAFPLNLGDGSWLKHYH